MTIDKERLRALAGAVVAESKLTGQRWPIDDDWFEPEMCGPEMDYVKAANPSAILELLDEIESLRKDAERYRFIRDADRSDGLLDVHDLGLFAMESLDEVVDAAIAKEQP